MAIRIGAVSAAHAAALDVSWDGRLAFDSEGIFVCDLPECRDPRPVGRRSRSRGRVRWTPDGRGVAYVDASGINVAVQPLDGGPPRQLTQFSDLRIVDFRWSADGTRLAVTRQATTTDIVLFRGLR